MAYVYTHTRLDNNEIFYVGIGSDKYYTRANDYHNRNKFWQNITSKTDYRVDIIADNLTREEAGIIERKLIKEIGRKVNNTGTLCNLSDGGECGAKGSKRSDEFRINASERMKNRIVSNETKNNMKNAIRVQIINTYTKVIYNSITSAAESIQINKHTLYGKLFRGNYNDTPMMLYSDYLKELEDIENYFKKNFD